MEMWNVVFALLAKLSFGLSLKTWFTIYTLKITTFEEINASDVFRVHILVHCLTLTLSRFANIGTSNFRRGCRIVLSWLLVLLLEPTR